MDETTTNFLKKVYKEYYFRNSQRIEFPGIMQEREFGYIPFGGGMVRHLSFKTPGELVAELVRQAPSSVYCSNATYSNPSLPMEEKGWKGAELIFDIDADSIPSACKVKHNRWYCQNCYKEGRLPKPSKCASCGTSSVIELNWVCKECLELTREHTRRLMDFLINDFGVSSHDVKIYFSGNRGYHIHIYDQRFEQLDSQARAELANYVRGDGLSAQHLARISATPDHDTLGWDARISRSLASHAPTKPSKKLLNEIIQNDTALIDQSVTVDIHRIFRMSGTLHGSTGMLKIRADPLENFDPEVTPVVLSDEMVEIFVNFCPAFQMRGSAFGPYNSQTVSIPTYAAVYLLAKGLAKK